LQGEVRDPVMIEIKRIGSLIRDDDMSGCVNDFRSGGRCCSGERGYSGGAGSSGISEQLTIKSCAEFCLLARMRSTLGL